MLKPLVICGHKLLRADGARIRKIARAVPESVVSVEFKLPLALLFKNLVANYLDFPLLRPVYSPGFIDISSV